MMACILLCRSFFSSNSPHFFCRNSGPQLSSLYHTTSYLFTMSSPTDASTTSTTDQLTIEGFVTALAAKLPTPGGGAAAAVGAAIGAGAASMAAAYTQRKKDESSGSAEQARKLQAALELAPLLQVGDDDAKAYAALQKTWKKDHGFTDDQIQEIQAEALRVPTDLVVTCHAHIVAINDFLEYCNPNITSDAKVGIHQLAGSAKAAYQTVLVNNPPPAEKKRLQGLLKQIQQIETELLKLDDDKGET